MNLFHKKIKTGFKSAPITIIKDLLHTNADCLIFDVRKPNEYNAVHIEGVINLPLRQIQSSISAYTADKKDTPIYVHCAYGDRSSDACALLVKLGYTDVTDLGGIIDWPFEIVWEEN